jgi:hypothetical protein
MISLTPGKTGVLWALWALSGLACASAPPPAVEPPAPEPVSALPAPPAEPAMAEAPAPPSVPAEPAPPAPAAEPALPAPAAPPSAVSSAPAAEAPKRRPAKPAARAMPAPAPAASPTPPATAPAAAAPAAGYTGPDACKHAGKGDSPVDKACREGGVKAAKAAMKAMLKDGRAAGIRHECEDCHTDDTDYAKLSKDAEDKFNKLLAATRK